MKRARFTDEQTIGILQEHEAGAKCPDLRRKHGMSEGTFYAWKSKFGGMTVPDAKRLKALEDEHGKLKRLLADTMLTCQRCTSFWQKEVGLLFSAK
jgi:putative transposase